MNKFLMFVMLCILLTQSVKGQQIFGLSYDVSFPTSNTKEFVSTTSVLGFGLDARKMTRGKYSYGITFHWNSFSEDRRERSDSDDNVIIIDDRSLESFPLLINAHYYFLSDLHSFRPFIGGNIGTYFIITRGVVDGIRRSETNWHFGLAPDIGFLLHFAHDIHMMITLRYNYGFKTGGSPAQSYLSVLFGFVSISLF